MNKKISITIIHTKKSLILTKINSNSLLLNNGDNSIVGNSKVSTYPSLIYPSSSKIESFKDIFDIDFININNLGKKKQIKLKIKIKEIILLLKTPFKKGIEVPSDFFEKEITLNIQNNKIINIQVSPIENIQAFRETADRNLINGLFFDWMENRSKNK